MRSPPQETPTDHMKPFLSISYLIMFLCDSFLPSFASGGAPSRGSRNQIAAGFSLLLRTGEVPVYDLLIVARSNIGSIDRVLNGLARTARAYMCEGTVSPRRNPRGTRRRRTCTVSRSQSSSFFRFCHGHTFVTALRIE